MGDNHGDVESLRRVLDDAENERFDLAVHVGDFTRAWRHEDRSLGVEQLRSVEPVLERIDAAADHGLAWVWGNQDYFGDIDYDLDVGTEIPDDDRVEVGGLRFTNAPDLVAEDVILVTHMETWSLLDHFDGQAHFCGNTHMGRHLHRRLNSAFLQVTHPETGEQTYGGYFAVELAEDGSMSVEMRSIGDLERRTCDRHGERGVQFQPSSRDCMYCWDRLVLYREMAASAFYGLTRDGDGDAATEAELVDYAEGLWEEPPDGFREAFAEYLATLEDDRYAPLFHDADGRVVVAEESYAY
jgi:hypothetical protein